MIKNSVRTYIYSTFSYDGSFEKLKNRIFETFLESNNTTVLKNNEKTKTFIEFESDSVPFHKSYFANHCTSYNFSPHKIFKNKCCEKEMYLKSDIVTFRLNGAIIIDCVKSFFIGSEHCPSEFSKRRKELKKKLDLIKISNLAGGQRKFVLSCLDLYKKYDNLATRKNFRSSCNEFNREAKTVDAVNDLFKSAGSFFEMVRMKYLLAQNVIGRSICSAFLVIGRMGAATLCIESAIDSELALNYFLVSDVTEVGKGAFNVFKKVNTFFDSFAPFLRSIDLNSIFNLGKKNNFCKLTRDHKTNKYAIINTDIDLSTAKSILKLEKTRKENVLRRIRFFNNYLSAECAYYKEYNETAIENDVMSEYTNNKSFEPAFKNGCSASGLVNNLLSNDTRNLFSSNETTVFSYINPIQILAGNDLKDLLKEKYYLAADFIDHKVRYHDKHTSFAVFTHLVVISISQYARLSLLCDSKVIDNKKMLYKRMPAIHNLNCKYSYANRLYNPIRMFHSIEYTNIANAINKSFRIDDSNRYLDEIVENYWQEANVTNGKYIPLIQIMLTIISFSLSFVFTPCLEPLCRILISIAVSATTVVVSFLLLFLVGKCVDRKKLKNPFEKNE